MNLHARLIQIFPLALGLTAILSMSGSAAWAETVTSFGVEAGRPVVETIGGVTVDPTEGVAVETSDVLSAGLPAAEDLDAFHFLPTSSVLFSTTTSVTLGGTLFGPDDVIEFDGAGYSLFFDGGNIVGTAPNIDAFSMLPNGNLLVSTSLTATIFGFGFLNGDVVEVDPVGGTAGLYLGLDEATLFGGANQDVDALHFDEDTGNLLVSVRTAGIGTIGGLPYSADESDVFEIEVAGIVTASSYLEGDGLYDGQTRQLDAVYVPEPTTATVVLPFAAVLLVGARSRLGRAC